MTVTDTTPQGQTESISFDFDLSHPPEKVWRAITDPALLSQWLLPLVAGRVDAGDSFTLRTQPQPGWDGTVNCRVLDMEPLKRLTYTWVVGDFLDTVVTFTLTPTAAGTKLTLAHRGFRPDQKQNSGGARYGWKMMGGRLVELLERIS